MLRPRSLRNCEAGDAKCISLCGRLALVADTLTYIECALRAERVLWCVCVCVCADTRALLLSSLAFNDLTDEIGPTLIALLPKLNKLQLIKCAARSLRLASS